MALQLPLALDEAPASGRRLWILSVDSERLPQLRQAVSGRVATVIEVSGGQETLAPDDAILIRIGQDRFEPHGRAAALFSDARDLSGDLSEHVIAAVAGAPDQAVEMIGFARGPSVSLPSENDPATSIERLIAALRGGRRRRGHAARLELCRYALERLDHQHTMLRAVLVAQARRLAYLLEVGQDVPSPSLNGRELVGTAIEHVIRPAKAEPAAQQPDLFPGGATAQAGPVRRDFSLTAFPIMGLRLDLSPLQADRFVADFVGEQSALRLDEHRLAQLFGDVRSRRLTADAELGDAARAPDAVIVRVDWDVRQRLKLLLPHAQGGGIVRVWLEASDGTRATVAKTANIGQQLSFIVEPRLLTSLNHIEGVVAFNSSFGLGARRKFKLVRAV